jgi:hypothetical protein
MNVNQRFQTKGSLSFISRLVRFFFYILFINGVIFNHFLLPEAVTFMDTGDVVRFTPSHYQVIIDEVLPFRINPGHKFS